MNLDPGAPPSETAFGARRARCSRLAAELIPAGSIVLDVSHPETYLQQSLPLGCSYLKGDWTTQMQNSVGGFESVAASTNADIIVALGTLEHIGDADGALAALRRYGRDVILSCHPADLDGAFDGRPIDGANRRSSLELAELFGRNAFRVQNVTQFDGLEILVRLTPAHQRPPIGRCSVAVISHNDVGNFGDRLGYHLIHSMLPSEAVVDHLTFNSLDCAKEKYDLVVLGIGNSIYEPLLDYKLIEIVSRGRAAMGIFGTQYRELLSRPALNRLLDRLVVWFARYQEDVLLYGRGRSNVEHFGDWLIDQFPMNVPTSDELLHIGDQILLELPLDRTIQYIQKYRLVYSTRLHPLICALTSAEAVAYDEQPLDESSAVVSGKFRSMLMDIFGKTYPEKQFFSCDREAVVRYKQFVRANLVGAKARVDAVLRSVVSQVSI